MEVCMIADKIKLLREASHLTQTELAKKLNITRNSVNAWEMGISVPSTTYLIELALLFHVSTDFLLGLEQNNTIDISTLSEREAVLIYELVDYFTSQKKDVVD
jgi:transcriptional regulator with XRE-family HTH domain